MKKRFFLLFILTLPYSFSLSQELFPQKISLTDSAKIHTSISSKLGDIHAFFYNILIGDEDINNRYKEYIQNYCLDLTKRDSSTARFYNSKTIEIKLTLNDKKQSSYELFGLANYLAYFTSQITPDEMNNLIFDTISTLSIKRENNINHAFVKFAYRAGYKNQASLNIYDKTRVLQADFIVLQNKRSGWIAVLNKLIELSNIGDDISANEKYKKLPIDKSEGSRKELEDYLRYNILIEGGDVKNRIQKAADVLVINCPQVCNNCTNDILELIKQLEVDSVRYAVQKKKSEVGKDLAQKIWTKLRLLRVKQDYFIKMKTGQNWMEQGKYKRALQTFSDASIQLKKERSLGDDEINFQIAKCYFALNEFDSCREYLIPYLNSLEVIHKDEANILSGQVYLLKMDEPGMKAEYSKKALDFFNFTPEESPYNTTARLGKVEVLKKLGQYEKALSILESIRYTRLGEDSLGILKGDLYYAAGQFDRALEQYRSLSSRITETQETYVEKRKGDCFIQLEKFKEAIDEFNKQVQRNPENPSALYGLSFAYFQNKRYDDAYDLLSKAIKYDPENTEYIILKIKSAFRSDNINLETVVSECEGYYRSKRFTGINKTKINSLYIYALLSQDNPALGKENMNKTLLESLDNGPESPFLLYCYACFLAKQNENNNALIKLKTAMSNTQPNQTGLFWREIMTEPVLVNFRKTNEFKEWKQTYEKQYKR